MEPADRIDKFVGEALHLADFVNDEEVYIRRIGGEDRNGLSIKALDVHAILADTVRALDVDVGQRAGPAVQSMPAKTHPSAGLPNLLGVEAGHSHFSVERIDDLRHRRRLAAARRTRQQNS